MKNDMLAAKRTVAFAPINRKTTESENDIALVLINKNAHVRVKSI